MSAWPGAVEHQGGGLVGRSLAGAVAVRIEVLRSRDVVALPASVAAIVEDERAGLAEPRSDLGDRELADIPIWIDLAM
jgi:hypothetical protein